MLTTHNAPTIQTILRQWKHIGPMPAPLYPDNTGSNNKVR